jgi:hypothetical protein
MNWKRIVAGGLAAGILIDVVERGLSGALFGSQFQSELSARGLDLKVGPAGAVFFTLWGFVLGFVSVDLPRARGLKARNSSSGRLGFGLPDASRTDPVDPFLRTRADAMSGRPRPGVAAPENRQTGEDERDPRPGQDEQRDADAEQNPPAGVDNQIARFRIRECHGR